MLLILVSKQYLNELPELEEDLHSDLSRDKIIFFHEEKTAHNKIIASNISSPPKSSLIFHYTSFFFCSLRNIKCACVHNDTYG